MNSESPYSRSFTFSKEEVGDRGGDTETVKSAIILTAGMPLPKTRHSQDSRAIAVQ